MTTRRIGERGLPAAPPTADVIVKHRRKFGDDTGPRPGCALPKKYKGEGLVLRHHLQGPTTDP